MREDSLVNMKGENNVRDVGRKIRKNWKMVRKNYFGSFVIVKRNEPESR